MIKGNKIEKKPKYGMRKLSLGLCSGILAFGMFFSSVGASRVAFAESSVVGDGLKINIFSKIYAKVDGKTIVVNNFGDGEIIRYWLEWEDKSGSGNSSGEIKNNNKEISIFNFRKQKTKDIKFNSNKDEINVKYNKEQNKLILSGFGSESHVKKIELRFKDGSKESFDKSKFDTPKKEKPEVEKPKDTPKKEKPEVEKPKDTPKKEKPEKVDARVEGNSIVVTNLKDRDTIKYSFNWDAGHISGFNVGDIYIEGGKIKIKDSSNLNNSVIIFNGDKKINVNYENNKLTLSEFGVTSIVKDIQLTLPDGKTTINFNKSQFDKQKESPKVEAPKKEKPEVEKPKEEKPKDTPKKEEPKVEKPKVEKPKEEKPKDTPKKEEKPKDTPNKEDIEEEQRRKERERKEDETARDRRNNNNQKYKKGWEEIGNKWTYRDEKGNKVISKWIYDLKYKSWYYLNGNGYMVANEWIKYTDNNWYYLLGNGKMAKSEWVYDKTYSSWYYFNNGGDMAANKWIQHTNNSWYYLLGNGKMAKSEWVYDKKYVSWYYFNNGGDMAANKWIQHTDNNWYYLLGNGKMAKSTRINGWYVNSKGIWEK
ncbi:hypothetical protein ABGF49_02960 [Helcococcus ovis]|uniref:hypothetical protein n=1 Tax=Helcococcus TaxID=31983 RepID=UPI0038B9BD1D